MQVYTLFEYKKNGLHSNILPLGFRSQTLFSRKCEFISKTALCQVEIMIKCSMCDHFFSQEAHIFRIIYLNLSLNEKNNLSKYL